MVHRWNTYEAKDFQGKIVDLRRRGKIAEDVQDVATAPILNIPVYSQDCTSSDTIWLS
jgi:hypothetical protein